MPLRNRPDRFGAVTKALHWIMAIGLVGMVGLGLVLVSMTVNLSTLWLFGLHKTIGIVLLALAALRLLWHRLSPPPAPADPGRAWERGLIRAVRAGFYALMLAIPLSGWAASSATGTAVVIFGALTLPPIAPASPGLSDALFALHAWLNWALLAVLAIHLAGTFRHRDGTLRRMLWQARSKRTSSRR